VDETLRAVRLLGRAGRWADGIQLCESVALPEARLVAAVLAADSYFFTGREGVAEALDRARETVGEVDEWALADARYRYGILLRTGDRDPAACRAASDRFAVLGRELADERLRGWARFYHAVTLDVLFEDHTPARAELAEVRATAEPFLLSYCLRHLAFHELEGPRGDRVWGAEMAWQSLTLRLVCGALPEAAAQLAYLAQLRHRAGDLVDARRLAEQAAAICTELGITGPVRDSIDELLGMSGPPPP
jgi:hypothetical protein